MLPLLHDHKSSLLRQLETKTTCSFFGDKLQFMYTCMCPSQCNSFMRHKHWVSPQTSLTSSHLHLKQKEKKKGVFISRFAALVSLKHSKRHQLKLVPDTSHKCHVRVWRNLTQLQRQCPDTYRKKRKYTQTITSHSGVIH